jgi:two-component system KDP operon response regulator KdpE
MSLRPSILIVDDEPAIRRFVRASLAGQYEVTEAATAVDGLRRIERERFDVIILDLGLPDADGLDLIREIRELSDAPIVVLSVRSDDDAKVRALDLGASDYITKPFSMPELVARLRTAMRHRFMEQGQAPAFQIKQLSVDLVRRIVTRAGAPVRLTPKEYDCLRLLVSHAGKVLTHQFMLREIWGQQHADQIQYLRGYIRTLRQKIEDDPAQPQIILTEPGVGYRLRPDD